MKPRRLFTQGNSTVMTLSTDELDHLSAFAGHDVVVQKAKKNRLIIRRHPGSVHTDRARLSVPRH